jgi:hypothetical protein
MSPLASEEHAAAKCAGATQRLPPLWQLNKEATLQQA